MPIADGGVHVYTVTVVVSVDPTAVTPENSDCEIGPGESGSGFLNTIAVSSNEVTEEAEDCEEIAGIVLDKEVDSGPTEVGENRFEVSYLVTATNNGAGDGTYTLDDEFSFGEGVDIVSAAVVNTTPGGIVSDPTWNGQDQTSIVTAQPIAGGAEHVYTVTVVVDISTGVSVRSGDCEVGDAESGSGFLNHATMTVNGDPMEAEDCVEVPGEEELTIDKDVSASTITFGDTLNYTVTVTNTGTVDFTAENPAEIVDDLTDVLDDATWVGNAAVNAGELSFESPELTWSGPLDVGDSVTITYSVRINNRITGSAVLHNVVSGVGGDSNCPPGASSEACETDTVIQEPPPPPAPPPPVTPDPIPVTG